MNSDDIKLVQENYGSLTTTAAPLSVQEFDENNIAIYKDFESLAVTIGVPAYDAGTTYNNDTSDSTTETFATYGSRFWQWVNVTDGNSTPAAGSDWVEVFPTMLAHEKNKDDYLGSLVVKFRIYQDSTNAPSVVTYQNPFNFTLATVYDAVGIYRVTGLTGLELTNTSFKYEMQVSEGYLLAGSSIAISPSTDESITINTRDNTGVNANDIMYEEDMGGNANWTTITIYEY